MTIFTLYILLLCNLSVSCSSGTYGAAFWCSSASSWMFTAKTERKWSFLPSRTSGAGCWWERKSDFSHKTYRRAPTHVVEVLRRQTVRLFRWRVQPAHLVQGMQWSTCPTLQTSSPPTPSQGSVYRVWPQTSLKISWHTIELQWVIESLYPISICQPHHWCNSNSLQQTEGS